MAIEWKIKGICDVVRWRSEAMNRIGPAMARNIKVLQ